MLQLVIALCASTPAQPAATRAAEQPDFTLTWEETAPASPTLRERFAVRGEELTYTRLPASNDVKPLVVAFTHAKELHALLEKIVTVKAATAPAPWVTASIVRRGAARLAFSGSPNATTSPAYSDWAALRDALRQDLGLIPPTAHDAPTSVGVATLKENGELWLRLYAAEPGKPVAEALLILKPGDERYGRYVDHLGGIKPGETKSIPPF